MTYDEFCEWLVDAIKGEEVSRRVVSAVYEDGAIIVETVYGDRYEIIPEETWEVHTAKP